MRIIIWFVLLVLATISTVLIVLGGIHQIVGWTLLGLTAAYLIFSFDTIDGKKGEIGALYIFNKFIKNLKPGIFFAPAFISSVRKEKGTVFQDELPSDPENIFRGDELPPTGKFPPIRVKFGPAPSNPTDPEDIKLVGDPYNKEMVVEVVPVVSWYIYDAGTFFSKIGNVENCRKILSDLTVSTFGEDFAKVTPAKASLSLKTTSSNMLAELKGKTSTWGIVIDEAYVKPFIFSHSLNIAVEGTSIADLEATATISKARGDAEATRQKAQGEKTKRIVEAEGAAEAVKITAAAEKERLVKTGLAKTDASGNITKLVPDANTKANADAIAALAKVTGTLVLGREAATPVINVQNGDK